MSDSEINDVIEFIRDQIPIKLDMRIKDIKYDTHSMYYKTLKYIQELREKIKELEEKWL